MTDWPPPDHVDRVLRNIAHASEPETIATIALSKIEEPYRNRIFDLQRENKMLRIGMAHMRERSKVHEPRVTEDPRHSRLSTAVWAFCWFSAGLAAASTRFVIYLWRML